MTASARDTLSALDLAVSAAMLSAMEARAVTGDACGVMYPFGVDGDSTCPACGREVFSHLGYPNDGASRNWAVSELGVLLVAGLLGRSRGSIEPPPVTVHPGVHLLPDSWPCGPQGRDTCTSP